MWDYYVKDNFLKKNNYDFLKNYSINPGDKKTLYVFKNNLTKGLEEEKELKDIFTSIHNSSILPKIDCYAWRYELVVSPMGLDYPWHPDTEDKIFSSITYIGDFNYGTIVGEIENDDNYKIIKWKENRNFSFYPTPNTWHKYKAITNRRTLCINAVTKGYFTETP